MKLRGEQSHRQSGSEFYRKIVPDSVEQVWKDAETDVEDLKEIDAYSGYGDDYDDWMEFDSKIIPNRQLSYDPFYASLEVKHLRKLNRDERRLPDTKKRLLIKNRLVKLKESLESQTHGMQELIGNLFESVNKNPEADFKVLAELVMSYAPQYRFTLNQLFILEKAINRYLFQHEKVKQIRKEYHDDADLFEACFGFAPEGQIEVVETPLTLHVKCFDESDFHRAYNNILSGEEDKKSTVDVAGTALSITNLSGTEDMVTLEIVDSVREKTDTLRHEEQHQFNKIFRIGDHFSPNRASAEKLLSKTPKKETNLTAEQIIRHWAREHRATIDEDRVRDELLACYRGGDFDLGQIEDFILNSPLYDYRKDAEDEIVQLPEFLDEKLRRTFSEVVYNIDPEQVQYPRVEDIVEAVELSLDIDKIRLIVEQVYKEEYERDVKKWVNALSILHDKGYSRDQIVHRCMAEPIRNWLKLAQRAKDLASGSDK